MIRIPISTLTKCFCCLLLFLLCACNAKQNENTVPEATPSDTPSARGENEAMEGGDDNGTAFPQRGSAEGLKFSLYPNPARDNVSIEINEMADDMRYFIVSGNGPIVLYGDIKNQKENISINGLENGIYYVKVISKYHPKPTVERLVIQN